MALGFTEVFKGGAHCHQTRRGNTRLQGRSERVGLIDTGGRGSSPGRCEGVGRGVAIALISGRLQCLYTCPLVTGFPVL